MRHRKAQALSAFLIALLFCVPPAAGQGSPVRVMLEASGTVEQFAEMGEMFREGFLSSAQQQSTIPADVAAALGDIAGRQMEGTRLLADIETKLNDTVTPEEAAAVTAFYRSPLGERVRRAEVAGSTTEVRTEIESHRTELRAELDQDPERRALIERIDRSLLATELSATIAVSLVTAIARAGLEAQEHGASADAISAVEKRLAGMHGTIAQQLRGDIATTFTRTYRDLSNSELTEYAEFLETDAARAVYAGMFAALNEIFQARGQEIGREFGAIIRQKKT